MNNELKYYFRETINPNWVNSTPDPVSLFIKYLSETGKIQSQKDDVGEYILLNDLLPFKGYKIPNTHYGFSSGDSYFCTIGIENLKYNVRSTKGFNLKYILNQCIDNDMYSWDYLDIREAIECIATKLTDAKIVTKLESYNLLGWFSSDIQQDITISVIGSVDWMFFAHATNQTLTMLSNYVTGYGGINTIEELRGEIWKDIHTLLVELNVKNFVFSSNSVYNVTETFFESLAKDKYKFYTSDKNKDMKYVRDYEYNDGLYRFSNPKGKHELKQNTFVCKDCGQLFHLYDEEIEFFKKKNLNTPRRCIKCRNMKSNTTK